MKDLLGKPWLLAILALVLMLGTQFAALKLYWHDLFPKETSTPVHVVKRSEPEAIQWGFSSDGLNRLKGELELRLSMLELKEEELAAYETRLKSDRIEIEEIKKQVEMMRDTLLEDIVRLEESEAKNLKILAKTYSELEPDATVKIFAQMDDAMVVKILFFMKSQQVGGILQEMAVAQENPKRAAKISDMLRLFTDDGSKKS